MASAIGKPNVPDVGIIGGGAAGLSAALVLGRARVHVVLVDAGQPSNNPSTGIGGLLGNDGIVPADFYHRAASELAAYPTVQRRSTTVTAIRFNGEQKWRLDLENGDTVQPGRILLAPGMHYSVPDIEGLEPRWGASVFHCPFCHGWEHRDEPLAMLGGPPTTFESAFLLRRWTDTLTLITGEASLTQLQLEVLESGGIRVIKGNIALLEGPGRDLETITLTDGARLRVTGLLLPAPHQQREPRLIEELGLATTPDGHVIADEYGATSVPGVWAAGDIVSSVASVPRAIAGGSTAAKSITHDLVAARISGLSLQRH